MFGKKKENGEVKKMEMAECARQIHNLIDSSGMSPAECVGALGMVQAVIHARFADMVLARQEPPPVAEQPRIVS